VLEATRWGDHSNVHTGKPSHDEIKWSNGASESLPDPEARLFAASN
jgi:hypothetical protein